MIAFLLALLLWILGDGPAPTPHGLTVPPATSAPASMAPAPVPVPPRLAPRPAPRPTTPPAPASPTVAEPTAQPTDHEGMTDDPCDVGEVWNRVTDLCDPVTP